MTLCTVTHQAPLSMGFSRQEHWSGLPCPPPKDLSDPGIELVSLITPALAGKFFTTSATWRLRQSRMKYRGEKKTTVRNFRILKLKKKTNSQTHLPSECAKLMTVLFKHYWGCTTGSKSPVGCPIRVNFFIVSIGNALISIWGPRWV